MTRVARVVVSSFLLVGAAGCATAGSTWVSQPEPGFFPNDDEALRASASSSAHPLETLAENSAPNPGGELDEAKTSRPRLTRTVTLGETYAAYTERAPESRSADRSNVNVTVNNYVTPQNDNYDGYYGYGYGVPVLRHPTQPIARPTRPGQSWPAPKSHGPAFPFKTAPASPWAPDR